MNNNYSKNKVQESTFGEYPNSAKGNNVQFNGNENNKYNSGSYRITLEDIQINNVGQDDQLSSSFDALKATIRYVGSIFGEYKRTNSQKGKRAHILNYWMLFLLE